MSLSLSTLSTQLTTLYTVAQVPVATLSKHASDMANAYDAYASGAIAFYGNLLLTRGKSNFLTQMQTILTLPNSLANYALIIENAVIAYWSNSTFDLTHVPPTMSSVNSITIVPPAANSIAPGLQTLLLASTGNGSILASNMASIINTGTLTTSLTYTGPSVTPPYPIINITGVTIS